MREITYTDAGGRLWLVQLPDGVPDSDAEQGVPVGPPPVADALGLPEPVATRLHNELARRKLWPLRDVRQRPADVFAALQRALQVDVQLILAKYQELEEV